MAQSRLNTRPVSNLNDLGTIHDPNHWFNYIDRMPNNQFAYHVLNAGVSSLEIFSCPPNKSQTERLEWLAFVLHNLIDRISIFYDFVTLRCNDGTREISLTHPLFYGAEVVLEDIGEEATEIIMSANSKCVGRIKIGSNECFRVQTSLYNPFPHMNFPEKCADVHESGLGASTYIHMMIDQFKTMRNNPQLFPYNPEQKLTSEFLTIAKYLIFHMMTIMSHITECHFAELAERKLNRHLFTLNLWVFMTGCQFNICPSASNVSSEFLLLCRYLTHNDFMIERTRLPPTQPIPVEQRDTFLDQLSGYASDDPQPGPSGLQNRNNAEKNTHNLVVEQRKHPRAIKRSNCSINRPRRKRGPLREWSAKKG